MGQMNRELPQQFCVPAVIHIDTRAAESTTEYVREGSDVIVTSLRRSPPQPNHCDYRRRADLKYRKQPDLRREFVCRAFEWAVVARL